LTVSGDEKEHAMTDQHVLHATFTLEPSYPATPARVFAAWAEPAAKARWFTVGGRAREQGTASQLTALTAELTGNG
jgi:uncharacterized protein YndB with AHSA1/START domain